MSGRSRGQTISLEQLNSLPTVTALEHCGAFFENSPWIVELALAEGPFANLNEFHATCMRIVTTAVEEKKLELIRAHPDLVGHLAREGRLGKESTAEQSAAGLSELSPDDVRWFERFNAEYFRRFGFPFVICARKNKKDAILAAFPRRLKNGRNTEIAVALAEIGDIARLRMNDAVTESHAPAERRATVAHLQRNSYGKQRVRLTKVLRETHPDGSPRHELQEYTVEIMLHGDFEAIYTQGDNANCGPTDTMKNTVYAIARQTSFHSPEAFGLALSARFIERFPQVQCAEVDIEMQLWKRIDVEGRPHPYAFIKQHGRRTASVTRSRDPGIDGLKVAGGITGMEVFKSSGSAFSGFYRDEYTTLAETNERILATTVDAVWDYTQDAGLAAGPDFNAAWDECYHTITQVFAGHNSPSLQATLYIMGEQMLERVLAISAVSFSMPNQHHILFDLSAFELDNPNEIYYGTDSPFGIITGTVTREPQAASAKAQP